MKLKNNMWDHYIKQHVERKNNEGFFTVVKPLKVFKKVRLQYKDWSADAIASLLIPKGAVVFIPHVSAFREHYMSVATERRCVNWKCRASYAKVVAIASITDREPKPKARSYYDDRFFYRVGETVRPRGEFSYDTVMCDSGIHFFFTLGEALGY